MTGDAGDNVAIKKRPKGDNGGNSEDKHDERQSW